MERQITDRDIELFLTRNAGKHASQLTLIGSALILLWPDGAPAGSAERIVTACLGHPTLTLNRLQVGVGA